MHILFSTGEGGLEHVHVIRRVGVLTRSFVNNFYASKDVLNFLNVFIFLSVLICSVQEFLKSDSKFFIMLYNFKSYCV